jgi:hypothetical protein
MAVRTPDLSGSPKRPPIASWSGPDLLYQDPRAPTAPRTLKSHSPAYPIVRDPYVPCTSGPCVPYSPRPLRTLHLRGPRTL